MAFVPHDYQASLSKNNALRMLVGMGHLANEAMNHLATEPKLFFCLILCEGIKISYSEYSKYVAWEAERTRLGDEAIKKARLFEQEMYRLDVEAEERSWAKKIEQMKQNRRLVPGGKNTIHELYKETKRVRLLQLRQEAAQARVIVGTTKDKKMEKQKPSVHMSWRPSTAGSLRRSQFRSALGNQRVHQRA